MGLFSFLFHWLKSATSLQQCRDAEKQQQQSLVEEATIGFFQ